MKREPANPIALAREAEREWVRGMRGWYVRTGILTGYALYLFFTV